MNSLTDNLKSVEFCISYPKYKSTLIIVDGFEINFPNKMPNIWIRLWQKLFLGFNWKAVKD